MTLHGTRHGPRWTAAARGLIAPLILCVAPARAPAAQAAARAPAGVEAGVAAADSIVTGWVEEERVPGAVLLISRGGERLLERAYGWAELYAYGSGQYGDSGDDGERAPPAGVRRVSDPRPMTPATVFDLASLTKVMATTFAVMLLVDEGALDLDAPLHRYLADFRGGGKERVTPRHLLTHRSGLAQWKPVYYHAENADAAYRYVRDLPLEWEVGEGRHYSDLGFMLLGALVERISGTSLDAFLEDRLYAPLGLASTGFRHRTDGGSAGAPTGPFAATSHGNPYERRMVRDSTFGYRIAGDPDAWDRWRGRTLSGEVNDGNAYHAFAGVAGHAGLFSTARELEALVRLLLEEGTHGGRSILGAAVVEEFLRPAVPGQALGWQAPPYAPAGSFTHTGFTGTWVLGVPSEDLAVVLLTNRQNLGVDDGGRYPDAGPLQRSVADALLAGR